jgi:leucyl-tRNA synthetase
MNTGEAWSEEAQNYWLPVDMYVGGVEHAVLHLLYARFWHKVLYDCGFVSTPEPFQTLRNQGLIVARSFQRTNGLYVDPADVREQDGKFFHRETGEELRTQMDKMSKSKLNGVTPDDVIDEFGADSLRLYEMFMGPLEKEKPWSTEAVTGCYRFLKRFYDMVTSPKVSDHELEEATKLGHRLIHGVGKDIESLQFNTAIAKMMEFINDFSKLESYPRSVVRLATQALSPFAPHLAEEAWRLLGGTEELSYAPWPSADPRFLTDDVVTYVVQVNGKVRGRLDMPRDRQQDEVMAAAQVDEHVCRFLDGKALQKVIFVPNRLLNIVVQ